MAASVIFQRIPALPRGTNVRVMNAAKFLSGGVMGSSAAASLILFEEKRVSFVAVMIFIAAAIVFAWVCLGPLTEFGPCALAVAAVLGIGAYSSARTTLKELVPWMPIIICLFLLLTVSFGPLIKSFITRDDDDENATLEEGTRYPLNTVPRPLGSPPRSHRSGNEPSPLANYLMDHEVSHMTRSEWRFPNRSQHSSDINLSDELESHFVAARRALSPSRAPLYAEILSQPPLAVGTLRGVYSDQTVQPPGYRSPAHSDSPPGSEVADHSVSDPGRSDSAEPLLRSAETER
ncbi:hypothetical protein F5884DRAFT_746514 [Xylogone sp. PMI_703]|nr:hypothetical protein F5884DRAFT_746514 [Xylogone sp. PMI_703]